MAGLNLVLAQGPNEASEIDFVQMIWDKSIAMICMLCQCFENSKEKCVEYFCEDFGEKTIGNFILHTLSKTFIEIDGKSNANDLIKREMKIVNNKTEKSKKLNQYQMLSWRDHKDVKDTSFIHCMLKKFAEQKNLILIHCSAGIGRPGTFATAAIAFEQFKKQHFQSMVKVLSSLRKQRCQAVQKAVQYFMIHMLLIECVERHLLVDMTEVKRKMRIEYIKITWR
uniref:Protein tyrosine phosphatase n=1 Tax=Panagrolaimus sp. ES5 TaxID=591445 RepID=A0AC34GVV7_9BILA